MISERNFNKAVPQLKEQNTRGLDFEKSNWDTFLGWKKQERMIMKNEKGSSVKILMPVFCHGQIVHETNKNGELVPVIREQKHHLFHKSQTREVASLATSQIFKQKFEEKVAS